MVFAYEVFLYLVFILGMPFFLITGLVRGKYLANVRERLGFYRTPRRPHDLWFHAVSVGETLASKTVVDAIERIRPGTSIVFTTTTITGQAQARRLFPSATVTYFPFDFSFSVRRCLAHHEPRVFATMETEIWPNVIRLSRMRGLKLLLANGRISDRSFPRYRVFRPVVARILQTYDRILAREELDRARFIAIGARPESVETTGNVKFDFEPDSSPFAAGPGIEQLIAGRRTIVLGSTIEGEDEMLAPVVATLVRDHGLFFIVAPRKPERFTDVPRIYAAAGLRVARRSAFPVAGPADVLVLDTLGELSRVYRYGAAAFVGGSLASHGGHNPIEPAAAGLPVCFGPSMSNFREIAAVFLGNGAAVEVPDAAAFGAFVREMTTDDTLRCLRGERARDTVRQNRGASEHTARRIVELLR